MDRSAQFHAGGSVSRSLPPFSMVGRCGPMFDGLRSTAQPSPVTSVLGAGREMVMTGGYSPQRAKRCEGRCRFMTKLVDVVHAAGARLLVVFFPLSYAIHKEDESRWRHLGVVDITQEADFDAAFVRYLNEHQIASINITQKLRNSANQGSGSTSGSTFTGRPPGTLWRREPLRTISRGDRRSELSALVSVVVARVSEDCLRHPLGRDVY